MPRATDSRDRILAAATAEFALRGFDGTTVDRISARARLNKAMIYYHFRSKHDLYSSVLRDIFTTIGDGLTAIAASNADPADKLDRFVAAFVIEGQAHAHVAPIMLREIAEGGRRLDEETYTVMVRVVRAMTGIVTEGRAAGQFGPVDPILLYLTTVWPIVVYLATTPIRTALARVAHFDVAGSIRSASSRTSRCSTGTPSCRRPPTRQRPETCHDPAPAHAECISTPIAVLALCGRARARGLPRGPPADQIRVSGYVEATEVRVAAEVGGRLIDLNVAEGNRVKAGDIVAQLDTADIALALQRAAAERQAADAQLRLLVAGARPEDIRQAEAQLAAADADLAAARQRLASAERDLKRFESLLASNSGAEKPRDDAATRRDVMRDRVNAGEQRVRAAAETVARFEPEPDAKESTPPGPGSRASTRRSPRSRKPSATPPSWRRRPAW